MTSNIKEEIDKIKKEIKAYENKSPFLNVLEISQEIEENQYTSLELFAGAGGMLLGFEKAGFKTEAVVEIDKHACNTLRENKPNLEILQGDIEQFIEQNMFEKYKGIDVVTGGFPCQSFSYIGNRKGLDDTRGTLFYSFAKVVSITKPKIFIAENVKGLRTHDNGKTLQIMIDVFQNLGYVLTYRVLNAVNYGVAQKRERVFIVGVRKDIYVQPFQYPEPYTYTNLLVNALQDVPPSIGKTYKPKKFDVMKQVPPGGFWRDLPLDVQKEYMMNAFNSLGGKTGMARRLSWYQPTPTLTTSPDMKQTEKCHPTETRPLTVREYARVQDFPDEWDFQGPITAQYRQIGNAVPVGLAYCLGLSVLKYLNEN